MANDNRGKTANATVQIYITRERDLPPYFVNEPYDKFLDAGAGTQSTVYTVTAKDDDLQVRFYF